MYSYILSSPFESPEGCSPDSRKSIGTRRYPYVSKLNLEYILNSPLCHTMDFCSASKNGCISINSLLGQKSNEVALYKGSREGQTKNTNSSDTETQLDSRDTTPTALTSPACTLDTAYAEELKSPMPDWALSYEAGHLDDLRLDADTLQAPRIVSGYATQRWSNKAEQSIATHFFEILARTPGGRMSCNTLMGTFEEWTGNKNREQSYRRALTVNPCFVNEASGTSNIRAWRIATAAEAIEAAKTKAKNKVVCQTKSKAKAEKRAHSESESERADELKGLKQEKRACPDSAFQESSEQPPKKRAIQSSPRTKLPSSRSPKSEAAAHHVAHRQQPSSPSTDRPVLAHHPADPQYSAKRSSGWTPINPERCPKSNERNPDEIPASKSQQRRQSNGRQNKEAVDRFFTASQDFNKKHLDLNYRRPLIPENCTAEHLEVSDDASGHSSGSSSGSSSGYFFDDGDRPQLTLHLQPTNHRYAGLYGAPCDMLSGGRCSCDNCGYERAYGYQSSRV